MKDVRDNAFSFLDDWYGRLDDIIEDLKNLVIILSIFSSITLF